MINQVILHADAQARHTDVAKIETFSDETFQRLIKDAITRERLYEGLTITSPSATEIEIAAGRLWDGPTGIIYELGEAQRKSVQTYLPVADERWLAISVIGQEVDAELEPLAFMIDVDTEQWEARTVATERQRQVAVQITAGIESPSPQKPEAPTSYLLVGYVRLDPTGVQEIQMADNQLMITLWEVYQRVLANERWINLADPKLATLVSDLAKLAKLVKGLAYMDMMTELARDVALLKDQAQLPDSYSSYGADLFLDPGESDTENAEYYARCEEGIRFPWAGQTEQQPALFNPYATEVRNFTGLILPAHTDVVRLATTGFAGGMSIGQYQYQTQTMKMGTRTRQRVRYGPTREVCTNGDGWWDGLRYNPAQNVFEVDGATYEVLQRYGEHGGHYWLRIRQYWVDTVTENYWYIDTIDHTINGSQIGQTFINSNSGWLKAIDLYFTVPAADGEVHLHLCETDLGLPDPTRCLGRATVAAGDLDTHPAPTKFELEQPVFLEAGGRYALLITTAGDHEVALVQGTAYTHGTLFQSTDGAYYQGDFTKDLMMRLHYAQFSNPRTTVELTTISLAEGIADLDMLLEAVVPDTTALIVEYQKDGTGAWLPVIADTADQLLGLPAMLKLRAVFNGSQDIIPGLSLPGSRIQANRPADTFKHVSTLRTLETASEDIDVILRLEAWDDAKHSCTVSLVSGGTTYAAQSMTEVIIADAKSPTVRRTYNFTPEAGAGGISEYQIVVEGTSTTALDIFHVAQRMDVAK